MRQHRARDEWLLRIHTDNLLTDSSHQRELIVTDQITANAIIEWKPYLCRDIDRLNDEKVSSTFPNYELYRRFHAKPNAMIFLMTFDSGVISDHQRRRGLHPHLVCRWSVDPTSRRLTCVWTLLNTSSDVDHICPFRVVH